DSNGQYNVASLSPGNYSAEFALQGFKKNVVRGLNIAPGLNGLDSSLQVGTATETVTVEAAADSLETQTAALSGNYGKLAVANRTRVSTGMIAGGGSSGGVFYATPQPPPPPSSLAIADARAMSSAAANGQGLGDLFEYKLKDRVTLKKNQSA